MSSNEQGKELGSALIKDLKKLEDIYGVKLIDRLTRKHSQDSRGEIKWPEKKEYNLFKDVHSWETSTQKVADDIESVGWNKCLDACKSAVASAPALIPQAEEFRKEAEDLLRSAYQISDRIGYQTNWGGFRTKVGEFLKKYHNVTCATKAQPEDKKYSRAVERVVESLESLMSVKRAMGFGGACWDEAEQALKSLKETK